MLRDRQIVDRYMQIQTDRNRYMKTDTHVERDKERDGEGDRQRQRERGVENILHRDYSLPWL